MRLRACDRLYLIADSTASPRRSLLQTVTEAVRAGVCLVQLRAKEMPDDEYRVLARQLRGITAEYHARLLLNSRIEIAREVGADGVHLPRDGSPAEMRQALGHNALVGISTHSEAELRRVEAQGADFAVLSPLFNPSSKPAYTDPLGLERFALLARDATIPVFALGGIRLENATECLRSGAYGVAVLGAIMNAPDVSTAVEEFLHTLGTLSLD